MIRLIATDLDGTLLSPDGQLSARTLSAIAAAAAAGVTIVVATGRSFRTAEHRLRAAPALRTLICSNGALVYDLHDDAIAAMRPISGSMLRDLFARLRRRVPEVRFGWETVEGFGVEPDFGRRPGDSEDDESLMGGPQTLDAVGDAIKAFVAHPGVEQVDLQRLLIPHLPAGLNGATSGARFVEVTAPGVDKGSTLSALAAEWGIGPTEVLAVGDQMNDESMLRWAGTAVAMGNARPEVKAIADFVAPSVDDEGASFVIERVVAGEL